jgi:hypothetical protein
LRTPISLVRRSVVKAGEREEAQRSDGERDDPGDGDHRPWMSVSR